MIIILIQSVSLPGGHKRCTLLQIQEAHNWSELQCRVHKQGWPKRHIFNSNERHKALYILRGLLRRPPSLEQSERQGLFFVVPVDSLVVDSTFKQNENVAIAVVSSRLRGAVYEIVSSKFMPLLPVHVCCTNS